MWQMPTNYYKLNATLSSMHLQYNGQHEKKSDFLKFYVHND
jgi:hypothetical protein